MTNWSRVSRATAERLLVAVDKWCGPANRKDFPRDGWLPEALAVAEAMDAARAEADPPRRSRVVVDLAIAKLVREWAKNALGHAPPLPAEFARRLLVLCQEPTDMALKACTRCGAALAHRGTEYVCPQCFPEVVAEWSDELDRANA